ncbi:hypothetical protein [Lactococcus lactis]|uniref:hypothetical protein n=1 Tax=Lactococcus lactis TaxID=1358 RepID=UPI0022DFF4B3|nr:hypothetical protein [Lactococcus lactis]
MKYRKKPVVVEAVQFTTGSSKELNEIADFIGVDTIDVLLADDGELNPEIIIHTFGGYMNASIGDFIIKDINGEFYPCKPSIFYRNYEAVE